MEFHVGQRVIRKSSERSGFIYGKNRRRVPMLEVRWEDSGLKEWLPAEEFRLWDKSEIPPPQRTTYRGRTTPQYINHIRSSKQCKDEREARKSPKDLNLIASALCKMGNNQKGRNAARKLIARFERTK